MELQIRTFKRSDIDPLHFLLNRSLPEAYRLTFAQLLSTLLEQDAASMVIEVQEAYPVQLAGVAVFREDTRAAQVDLLLLVVDPDYRQLGLGRRLLDWAVRFGRGQGLNSLVFQHQRMDAEATPFLESVGFVHRPPEESGPVSPPAGAGEGSDESPPHAVWRLKISGEVTN